MDLLPIAEDLLENTIQDMREHGYYPSKPVVLAIWPGLDTALLIDGHMRVRAAREVGITHVPFVRSRFDSEMATVQHVINLQQQRRTTTNAALYRLCGEFDRLMGRGGDRRSEEAKSMPPRGGIDRGRSASARATAQIIRCHFRKVERIRKIRRDGTPQIQDDVRNGKMTINKAFKLIRDMELGTENGERKGAAARIKAAKALCGEETFVFLQE